MNAREIDKGDVAAVRSNVGHRFTLPAENVDYGTLLSVEGENDYLVTTWSKVGTVKMSLTWFHSLKCVSAI